MTSRLLRYGLALLGRGTTAGTGTLLRFFDRHGITRKKTGHAIEKDRPDVLRLHRDWFGRQLELEPERNHKVVDRSTVNGAEA